MPYTMLMQARMGLRHCGLVGALLARPDVEHISATSASACARTFVRCSIRLAGGSCTYKSNNDAPNVCICIAVSCACAYVLARADVVHNLAMLLQQSNQTSPQPMPIQYDISEGEKTAQKQYKSMMVVRTGSSGARTRNTEAWPPAFASCSTARACWPAACVSRGGRCTRTGIACSARPCSLKPANVESDSDQRHEVRLIEITAAYCTLPATHLQSTRWRQGQS